MFMQPKEIPLYMFFVPVLNVLSAFKTVFGYSVSYTHLYYRGFFHCICNNQLMANGIPFKKRSFFSGADKRVHIIYVKKM